MLIPTPGNRVHKAPGGGVLIMPKWFEFNNSFPSEGSPNNDYEIVETDLVKYIFDLYLPIKE